MRTAALSSVWLALVVLAGCEGTQQRALDHYVQGQLLVERGNDDAALKELTTAIKTDPQLTIAHTTVGDIYRRRGDYEHAVASYETACKTDPYDFRPHYNLGVTYQLIAEKTRAPEDYENNMRQAIRVFLRAISIEPDDFEANLDLSACYFQLGKYDLAEQYCRSAIGINAKSPQAFGNLGVILDSQNRLDDAIDAYKCSLELDTNQPTLLLNLGSTYMRLSRPKAALNAYKIAADQDANCAGAYEQMGACYFQLNDYPKAEEAYKTAVTLEPSGASCHRGLGVVLMAEHLQDRTNVELRRRALTEWGISLELQPSQSDLQRLIEKYK